MEKTWRWFGKKDKITLPMLRQIGVEGIVTALHDIPNGEVWMLEAINDLKAYIEEAGLRWSVVESLPVSEAIKYAGDNRDQLIENYIISLENLGKAGIKTVCYNFMPVIDWIRTDLNYKLADGSSTLFFNKDKFFRVNSINEFQYILSIFIAIFVVYNNVLSITFRENISCWAYDPLQNIILRAAR